MTIELNRNTEYTYRVNPFQPRNLDRRKNTHGARWEHWKTFTSTMAAIEALLAAQREAKPVTK